MDDEVGGVEAEESLGLLMAGSSVSVTVGSDLPDEGWLGAGGKSGKESTAKFYNGMEPALTA